MAKNLKINIKNTQIAQAINLSGIKSKLAKKKAGEGEKAAPGKAEAKDVKRVAPAAEVPAEEAPRIRARSKSAFAEGAQPEVKPRPHTPSEEAAKAEIPLIEEHEEEVISEEKERGEKLRRELFGETTEEEVVSEVEEPAASIEEEPTPVSESVEAPPEPRKPPEKAARAPIRGPYSLPTRPAAPPPRPPQPAAERLGPTGRHVKDLIPPKPKPQPPRSGDARGPHPSRPGRPPEGAAARTQEEQDRAAAKTGVRPREETTTTEADADQKKGLKSTKFKEFRDIKPAKRQEGGRAFDVRDRHGLRASEEEGRTWKKRRSKVRTVQEDTTVRPSSLKVRLPITIKDLAGEMKLKASQLVQKLFLQGVIVTLNDLLEDETTIQLLGHEFGCEISIDTSEEERIRITDKTIKEEIGATPAEELGIRPPIVAFMGHVDHGKTSLIDSIRKSNRASGEAGAITQHIGAFRCSTAVGDIAILDTPGHEAFSAMRARGADVTDIVVLVVAGDEGIRQQTIEAIQRAKEAKVTIVVAINKCDKPNFNAETVYRQLADHELLPETWGGQTITVNCSAVTGKGIPELLEMLALQAEVLELKANANARARGTVLESEMHKGLGAKATVLVQNGTLRLGDPLVFGGAWCRVKTMHDEFGKDLKEAGPSTPVEITGLSGLPEAGQEFIVVKSEKEARSIAEARQEGVRQFALQQKKKVTMENLLEQQSEGAKKVLNLILRADVQGSLEAVKTALEKIKSTKAELNIISSGVGEIAESDIQLAAVSKSVILGFHTAIESHAETLMKQLGIKVRLHDIIYHAIDDIKDLMVGLLDKIAEEIERGKAEVRATFKASQLGTIAGCAVIEGTIARNSNMRLKRKNEVVWKGSIGSLKRGKEDVREVQKGIECGILLQGNNDVLEGDILEAYDINYITQEL